MISESIFFNNLNMHCVVACVITSWLLNQKDYYNFIIAN